MKKVVGGYRKRRRRMTIVLLSPARFHDLKHKWRLPISVEIYMSRRGQRSRWKMSFGHFGKCRGCFIQDLFLTFNLKSPALTDNAASPSTNWWCGQDPQIPRLRLPAGVEGSLAFWQISDAGRSYAAIESLSFDGRRMTIPERAIPVDLTPLGLLGHPTLNPLPSHTFTSLIP